MTAEARIVLVDDAPDVRTVARAALRLSDRFRVVGEAADGSAAVALAEKEQPDLMLLDVSMPVMDGLEALPLVLAASPRTRVVMYTGFDENGLADRARELGASGFVQKSATPEELVDVLAAVASGPDDADAARRPSGGSDIEAPRPAAIPTVPARDTGVLAEHMERFREVFDEAAIGMATMTLSGHLVRVNRALAELAGRPANALVGVRYADVLGDDGAIGDALRDVHRGAGVAQFEHDVIGADRRVLVTIAPIRDSHGRSLYVFLQVQDVTVQRGAESQLRSSEEAFRLLVEAVEDYAIFMLSPDGTVASWNLGAQRIKGYSAEEIVGRHLRVFYPPERQAQKHPELELERALLEGHYEEEGWRVRKDGSRFWANVVLTPIRDQSGEHVGFAKVTRDMTERRRLTETLEAANRRLEEAAADQANFLAVTAHELRTPVGVLGASTDMLGRHWDQMTEQERTDLLASMASSTDRLRRLVDDLLTASRLGRGRMELRGEPVPVAPVVEAAVEELRRVRGGVEVKVAIPEGTTVYADRNRLAQALDNLLANAVSHGAPPIQVESAERDGMVEIRVRDSGAGVPDEIRDRLFERFVTGKPESGTGLGLFIVRELARAQGGDAYYDMGNVDGGNDGADGAGVFVVSLPAGPQ